MKLIVITQPEFFEDEAAAITSLFDAGLEILHLRKPGASYEDMDKLLRRLPAEYMERIVTHDHFGLASERNLKGVHLNGRNPAVPAGFTGHVSRSCHSLEEVVKYKATCDYVFLSPIYDSISKEGYASAFTSESIREAAEKGIIDKRVIALGGVDENNLLQVKDFGFGGAAILGGLWNKFDPASDYNYQELIAHFRKLKRLAD